MLVFIGKLSLSSLRWVPMCQGFSQFPGFLHHSVLAKLATSIIRLKIKHEFKNYLENFFYFNQGHTKLTYMCTCLCFNWFLALFFLCNRRSHLVLQRHHEDWSNECGRKESCFHFLDIALSELILKLCWNETYKQKITYRACQFVFSYGCFSLEDKLGLRQEWTWQIPVHNIQPNRFWCLWEAL